MLAMEVNDNAGCQMPSGALKSIASKLAPTQGQFLSIWLIIVSIISRPDPVSGFCFPLRVSAMDCIVEVPQ